ncbi:MAG: thioredoxin, partial [gamma proteobacterium symbiont of Ctena orbiculata]
MKKLLQYASIVLSILLSSLSPQAFAIDSETDIFAFDDFPLEELLQYPGWFKKSFLDLPEDLSEA